MDDYIAATEAEEQRLTDELSRNPAFVKLQAVRAVLEAYRSAAKPITAVVAAVGMPRAFDSGIRSPGPRAGSLAARLRPVVLDYLKQKGGRAQTAELLEVVTKAGIEIGGQKPSGTLSSYLSNMREELDHRHGEGYGIKKPGEPETPAASEPEDTKQNMSQPYTGGVFGTPEEQAGHPSAGSDPDLTESDGDDHQRGSGT